MTLTFNVQFLCYTHDLLTYKYVIMFIILIVFSFFINITLLFNLLNFS